MGLRCRKWRNFFLLGRQVVSELQRRSEEIAQIITMESGKAIKDARQEVDRSIDTFELASEEVSRIYGEYMPFDISARTKGMQVSLSIAEITPNIYCSFQNMTAAYLFSYRKLTIMNSWQTFDKVGC